MAITDSVTSRLGAIEVSSESGIKSVACLTNGAGAEIIVTAINSFWNKILRDMLLVLLEISRKVNNREKKSHQYKHCYSIKRLNKWNCCDSS